MSRRVLGRSLLGATIGGVLLLPAGAQAQSPGTSATGIDLAMNGTGKVRLLDRVVIDGQLASPGSGDSVQVTVSASGRRLSSEKVQAKPNGSFQVPVVVNACCGYVVEAEAGGRKDSVAFEVEVPKRLGKGPATSLFNRSLQAQGFHTGTKGRRVTMGTRLAIKAFRKTNGMARSFAYRSSIFEALLRGEGAFRPRDTGGGRHVEVDLSKQVMSLIQGGVPVHTFSISSGKSSTPTIRGRFRFYRREPGYNNKRMYFSVYFRGGYAIHGYDPVPNYPASHGCVRNPIPFSRFIYNWVQIGMPIYVYR